MADLSAAMVNGSFSRLTKEGTGTVTGESLFVSSPFIMGRGIDL